MVREETEDDDDDDEVEREEDEEVMEEAEDETEEDEEDDDLTRGEGGTCISGKSAPTRKDINPRSDFRTDVLCTSINSTKSGKKRTN